MTSDHADSFKIMVHMEVDTAQKMMFSIKDSSVNVNKSEETADLVTFTEEILNGKLHFLCSVGTYCLDRLLKKQCNSYGSREKTLTCICIIIKSEK